MSGYKSFRVFGNTVEVIAGGDMTGGLVTVVTSVSPPGGGPPLHVHTHEDELFTILEGKFEIFDGSIWHPLREGESFFAQRDAPHTFRNCGMTEGKIHIVSFPAGLDRYFEEVSPLQIPQDLEAVFEISHRFGIRFLMGTEE